MSDHIEKPKYITATLQEHIEKPKYITATLQGGLGNQLFQIFTAIAVGDMYQLQPIFKNVRVSSEYPNTYRETYYDTLFANSSGYLSLYEPSKDQEFNWYEVEFDTLKIDKERNNKIFGYFQSFYYFHHIAPTIIDGLRLVEKQLEVTQRYPQILSNVGYVTNVTNVAVHFRLGDYKHKQQHHPLVSLSYYANCLRWLQQEQLVRLDTCNFVVFCEREDEETVSVAMRYLGINTFVLTTECTDVEQFLLMSNCDYIFTANSTFSWWAAYIGQHIRNTIKVTIPFRWFHSSTPANYIVPGWKVIEYH
jgi:hypothetical protein